MLLHDLVLKKKQDVSGITSNPTLDAFDLEFCEILDDLATTDQFVKERVNETVKELELAARIDYNSHYKTAFDSYNEAVCYYLLQSKECVVSHVPESSVPTPDFEVKFTIKGEEIPRFVFLEVKSLSFAGNNLQYRKVQQDSLEMHISMEKQRKRGKRVCSGFYEVSPLGDKAVGLTSEIEILIKKIDQNIKEGQYKNEKGQDTILFVDLSQFIFPFEMCECLPIFPDILRKCSESGRLWMLAFGRIGERIYTCCEFPGKKNFDVDLQQHGILERYEFIKGIIFGTGSQQGKKKLYGLYRSKDDDTDAVAFMRKVCDFVNDDKNSWGYEYFDNLERSLFARWKVSKASEDPNSTNK